MSYEKQTWDTTSFVNPTRMNHIENGIKSNSDKLGDADISAIGSSVTEAVSSLNQNITNIQSGMPIDIDLGEFGVGSSISLNIPTEYRNRTVIAWAVVHPTALTRMVLSNEHIVNVAITSDGKVSITKGSNTSAFSNWHFHIVLI